MVTAAGVAMANRLPVLMLSGDTFQSRLPDPVLQQVEHFGAPSTTANDAFRAVVRYWDRITRPEQVLASLPLAVCDDARPGGLRPGVPRPAPGRAGRGVRLPDRVLRRDGAHRSPARGPIAARWTRRRRRAARGRAAADGRRRRRPLLARRGRARGVRRAPRHPGRRDGRRQVHAGRRPPAATPARSASSAADGANRLAAEADVVLAVGTRLQDFTTGSWSVFRNDAPDHRCERRPLRRRQAPRRWRWSATPARRSSSSTRRSADWRAPAAWTARVRGGGHALAE